MPSRILFPLIGLAIVGAVLGIVLYSNRGSHIELRGEIQKVRTHATEEKASIAILDFRFVNPANYPFVVRTVDVFLEGKDGSTTEGLVVADPDAARYMKFYPVLGPKYNDSLVIKEKIAPKAQLDKMLMVRYEVPESTLADRKRFRIKVLEIDGAVSEIVEKEAAR